MFKSGYARHEARKVSLVLLVVVCIAMMIGCSSKSQNKPTEDLTFLTPIPQETMRAYRSDTPLENTLQAVIAARAGLTATRLRYAEVPKVVSVEELNLADAQKRVAQPGVTTYEDRPGDTKVWLVIFESQWQVIPPDPFHTVTPPPSPGCVYVMLDAHDGGRSSIGGIECPRY